MKRRIPYHRNVQEKDLSPSSLPNVQTDIYVVVKTKTKDVFDVGVGPQRDKNDTHSFSENVLYNINTNEVVSDNLGWARDDVEGMTNDASIIVERDFHEKDNLDFCKFIVDESNNEETTRMSTPRISMCNSLVVYYV